MRSVADALAAETHRRVKRMSPDRRLQLALELGERDLEAFRRAHGLERSEALRVLQRRRQAGRRRSRAMEELIG